MIIISTLPTRIFYMLTLNVVSFDIISTSLFRKMAIPTVLLSSLYLQGVKPEYIITNCVYVYVRIIISG